MRVTALAASLCFALSWLTAGAAGAQEPNPSDRLRLGTWNLEWFGCRQIPRTSKQVDEVAAQIRSLDVDVLAVEEIGGEWALGQLCQRLGPNFGYALGTTGGSLGGTTLQAVGFLWNRERVELLQVEELMTLPRELDGKHLFNRVPVAASFRALGGGLDFRAVVLHMKAIDRRDPNKTDHKGAKVQAAEARALAQLVRETLALAGEDRDLVLLGDFNHFRGETSHEILGQELHYLTPPEPTQTIVHFTTQIDQIALSPSLQQQVVAGSAKVHNARLREDKGTWLRTYSDHCPVTVDLDASADLDPAATLRALAPEHALAPQQVLPPPTPGLVLSLPSSEVAPPAGELGELLLELLAAVQAGAGQQLLQALRPTPTDLEHTLVEQDDAELARYLAKQGSRLPRTLRKLAKKGGKLQVDVQLATTEELRRMSPGTAASDFFPAGLQGVAEELRPQRTLYCARFLTASGKVRSLQVFTRCGGRYVCLGKAWLAPR